jgi:hypothetical protein
MVSLRILETDLSIVKLSIMTMYRAFLNVLRELILLDDGPHVLTHMTTPLYC